MIKKIAFALRILGIACALMATQLFVACGSAHDVSSPPTPDRAESAYAQSTEKLVFSADRSPASAITRVAMVFSRDDHEVVRQDVDLSERGTTAQAMTELFQLLSPEFVQFVGKEAAARRDQATGDDKSFLALQAGLFGQGEKHEVAGATGESAYSGECNGGNSPVCGWCSNGEKTCCCPTLCPVCGPFGCVNLYCGCGGNFRKNC